LAHDLGPLKCDHVVWLINANILTYPWGIHSTWKVIWCFMFISVNESYYYTFIFIIFFLIMIEVCERKR
jgi:hypothetical protein